MQLKRSGWPWQRQLTHFNILKIKNKNERKVSIYPTKNARSQKCPWSVAIDHFKSTKIAFSQFICHFRSFQSFFVFIFNKNINCLFCSIFFSLLFVRAFFVGNRHIVTAREQRRPTDRTEQTNHWNFKRIVPGTIKGMFCLKLTEK